MIFRKVARKNRCIWDYVLEDVVCKLRSSSGPASAECALEMMIADSIDKAAATRLATLSMKERCCVKFRMDCTRTPR